MKFNRRQIDVGFVSIFSIYTTLRGRVTLINKSANHINKLTKYKLKIKKLIN